MAETGCTARARAGRGGGPRVAVLALLAACAAHLHAADIWEPGGMAPLCAESAVPTRDDLASALGAYLEVVVQREGLAAARIRKADPARLVPVLQRAATLGKGPLDVFTDAQFAAGGPCVLFLDESALAAVDRQFDLHGLWMVRAPVVGEGDTPLSMRYMLIGDGRLVVGYPRQATVRVADYAIFTGRYDYQPYMALDIVSNAQQRMLAGLRTLGDPSGIFGAFVGPLGAQIQALELAGDEVVVRYRAWGNIEQQMRVRHPPITPR